jgi:hypothetical protein
MSGMRRAPNGRADRAESTSTHGGFRCCAKSCRPHLHTVDNIQSTEVGSALISAVSLDRTELPRHESRSPGRRCDRRLRRSRAAPRGRRRPSHRPWTALGGHEAARSPGPLPARRLHRARPRHRRPDASRPGRLRLPGPEGQLVRGVRAADRALAARDHGGGGRPERHPLVVLPPARRPPRRPPRRERGPGRRGQCGARARTSRRMRRLRGDRTGRTRCRTALGRHPVLRRRARPECVQALRGLQRGNGRRPA